jgi:peptidoglycan/xylan/chitin deacetylase (PgdA/CDA1 family)
MTYMIPNLWSTNTPQKFWLCNPDPPAEIWNLAIQNAIHILDFPIRVKSIEAIMEYALGEARFGKNRYKTGMVSNLYYLLKPLLPRSFIFRLRQAYNTIVRGKTDIRWPIESRYVKFQWEILRQVLLLSEKNEITFRYFWPQGKKYAFILTHDIETADGQRLAPVLADMEEALGFHSMFNFVPEVYPLDLGLIRELQGRGFEIGVHGLKHDNTLFDSYDLFTQRSARINQYLDKFQARGFRAPLTIRNPEWMQLLDMEYDLSFFDTDPYEPIPGGVMSIWPFTIGRFMELPYTLPQDSTLFKIMGETSPRMWFEKIDFIERYHGMALGIVHPDYSGEGKTREIYRLFLNAMRERTGYWHALPQEVASWWKNRNDGGKDITGEPPMLARAALVENNTSILISTTTSDSVTRSQIPKSSYLI